MGRSEVRGGTLIMYRYATGALSNNHTWLSLSALQKKKNGYVHKIGARRRAGGRAREWERVGRSGPT